MSELSLCTKDSFDEVLQFYSGMVYRLAFARVNNTFDANDITQDVFLKYIRADKTFNCEEHRKAWLIKTTVNTAKSLLTSSWNRRRSDSETDSDKLNGGAEDKQLLRLETESAVYTSVMSLPQKYRVVVHLFYYEDMSVEAVSKATGRSVNTVKSQLHRARNILREKLEGVEFND